MNTEEDEPLSSLNGRLRPRKSTTASLSPLNKSALKRETKSIQTPSNTSDKPKKVITPSKAPPNIINDLAINSDSSTSLQLLCPYCDRKFASKQNALKHARRIHLSTSKQDHFIKCLHCSHSEAEPNDIIKHMVDRHPNQYFACLDCHTRFSSTSELAQHKLNVCHKPPYRSKLRQNISSGTRKKSRIPLKRGDIVSNDAKEYLDDRNFNGIVISCELKPSQYHDALDIEDKITTNLILPPSKALANSVMEKNAVIVLDDIQWNKRIPPNFSFHNNDTDQILSRLGVVHRSPRVGETTRKEWIRIIDESNQKYEKCFDTNFYSKVAKNVEDNIAKFLDGTFKHNTDHDNNTIKTRRSKTNIINTAEGFPILLAYEQYSRNMLYGSVPRAIAPKHKWKWGNVENDKNMTFGPNYTNRDNHINDCIVTLVSSLDIWTQLRMRRKFEEIFKTRTAKKVEKKNVISLELKEILESRDIPSTSSHVVSYRSSPVTVKGSSELPSYLGLSPMTIKCEVQPAVLSGEWVRPRCYVCCACGAQTHDSRALTSHISSQHPNAQVQHYEIVGEPLLSADILKYLYVPPSQMSNRTRPPRGFRDCTKCKKSITLEDLHQHMLDCAGDTPAVRRKCRYRPFGVRRRRTRLPDNTIRKKMRKDITTRRLRPNLRPRPRMRTEVGDAETIRKMIADLPAKRNRICSTNLLRPRSSIHCLKSSLKIRGPEDCRSSKSRTLREFNKSKKSETNFNQIDTKRSLNIDEDDQPLKFCAKRSLRKVTHSQEASPVRSVRNKTRKKKQTLTTANPVYSRANESLEQTFPKVGMSNRSSNQRNRSNFRGRSNFGESGNNNRSSNRRSCDQQPAGGRNVNNDDKNFAKSESDMQNTANVNINVNNLFQPFQNNHLLSSQEAIVPQTGSEGLRKTFENETVPEKFDKPPLPNERKSSPQPGSQRRDRSKSKTKKGLNDCIAMLHNKQGLLPLEQATHSGRDESIDPSPPVIVSRISNEPIVDMTPAQVFSRESLLSERFRIDQMLSQNTSYITQRSCEELTLALQMNNEFLQRNEGSVDTEFAIPIAKINDRQTLSRESDVESKHMSDINFTDLRRKSFDSALNRLETMYYPNRMFFNPNIPQSNFNIVRSPGNLSGSSDGKAVFPYYYPSQMQHGMYQLRNSPNTTQQSNEVLESRHKGSLDLEFSKDSIPPAVLKPDLREAGTEQHNYRTDGSSYQSDDLPATVSMTDAYPTLNIYQDSSLHNSVIDYRIASTDSQRTQNNKQEPFPHSSVSKTYKTKSIPSQFEYQHQYETTGQSSMPYHQPHVRRQSVEEVMPLNNKYCRYDTQTFDTSLYNKMYPMYNDRVHLESVIQMPEDFANRESESSDKQINTFVKPRTPRISDSKVSRRSKTEQLHSSMKTQQNTNKLSTEGLKCVSEDLIQHSRNLNMTIGGENNLYSGAYGHHYEVIRLAQQENNSMKEGTNTTVTSGMQPYEPNNHCFNPTVEKTQNTNSKVEPRQVQTREIENINNSALDEISPISQNHLASGIDCTGVRDHAHDTTTTTTPSYHGSQCVVYEEPVSNYSTSDTLCCSQIPVGLISKHLPPSKSEESNKPLDLSGKHIPTSDCSQLNNLSSTNHVSADEICETLDLSTKRSTEYAVDLSVHNAIDYTASKNDSGEDYSATVSLLPTDLSVKTNRDLIDKTIQVGAMYTYEQNLQLVEQRNIEKKIDTDNNVPTDLSRRSSQCGTNDDFRSSVSSSEITDENTSAIVSSSNTVYLQDQSEKSRDDLSDLSSRSCYNTKKYINERGTQYSSVTTVFTTAKSPSYQEKSIQVSTMQDPNSSDKQIGDIPSYDSFNKIENTPDEISVDKNDSKNQQDTYAFKDSESEIYKSSVGNSQENNHCIKVTSLHERSTIKKIEASTNTSHMEHVVEPSRHDENPSENTLKKVLDKLDKLGVTEDQEMGRKILSVPKALFEILRIMADNHRDQMFTVLPEFVLTTLAANLEHNKESEASDPSTEAIKIQNVERVMENINSSKQLDTANSYNSTEIPIKQDLNSLSVNTNTSSRIVPKKRHSPSLNSGISKETVIFPSIQPSEKLESSYQASANLQQLKFPDSQNNVSEKKENDTYLCDPSSSVTKNRIQAETDDNKEKVAVTTSASPNLNESAATKNGNENSDVDFLTPSSSKQKSPNDKTASLRAVRIKPTFARKSASEEQKKVLVYNKIGSTDFYNTKISSQKACTSNVRGDALKNNKTSVFQFGNCYDSYNDSSQISTEYNEVLGKQLKSSLSETDSRKEEIIRITNKTLDHDKYQGPLKLADLSESETVTDLPSQSSMSVQSCKPINLVDKLPETAMSISHEEITIIQTPMSNEKTVRVPKEKVLIVSDNDMLLNKNPSVSKSGLEKSLNDGIYEVLIKDNNSVSDRPHCTTVELEEMDLEKSVYTEKNIPEANDDMLNVSFDQDSVKLENNILVTKSKAKELLNNTEKTNKNSFNTDLEKTKVKSDYTKTETLEEDDSEDDIVLALISKQKHCNYTDTGTNNLESSIQVEIRKKVKAESKKRRLSTTTSDSENNSYVIESDLSTNIANISFGYEENAECRDNLPEVTEDLNKEEPKKYEKDINKENDVSDNFNLGKLSDKSILESNSNENTEQYQKTTKVCKSLICEPEFHSTESQMCKSTGNASTAGTQSDLHNENENTETNRDHKKNKSRKKTKRKSHSLKITDAIGDQFSESLSTDSQDTFRESTQKSLDADIMTDLDHISEKYKIVQHTECENEQQITVSDKKDEIRNTSDTPIQQAIYETAKFSRQTKKKKKSLKRKTSPHLKSKVKKKRHVDSSISSDNIALLNSILTDSEVIEPIAKTSSGNDYGSEYNANVEDKKIQDPLIKKNEVQNILKYSTDEGSFVAKSSSHVKLSTKKRKINIAKTEASIAGHQSKKSKIIDQTKSNIKITLVDRIADGDLNKDAKIVDEGELTSESTKCLPKQEISNLAAGSNIRGNNCYNKDNSLLSFETKTACYNKLCSNGTNKIDRANYDPYDIDLEDMIEDKEPMKKKKHKIGGHGNTNIVHENKTLNIRESKNYSSSKNELALGQGGQTVLPMEFCEKKLNSKHRHEVDKRLIITKNDNITGTGRSLVKSKIKKKVSKTCNDDVKKLKILSNDNQDNVSVDVTIYSSDDVTTNNILEDLVTSNVSEGLVVKEDFYKNKDNQQTTSGDLNCLRKLNVAALEEIQVTLDSSSNTEGCSAPEQLTKLQTSQGKQNSCDEDNICKNLSGTTFVGDGDNETNYQSFGCDEIDEVEAATILNNIRNNAKIDAFARNLSASELVNEPHYSQVNLATEIDLQSGEETHQSIADDPFINHIEPSKKDSVMKWNDKTGIKDKMYPDFEEIDIYEDKFDKIKRKRRSQAVAAKQIQSLVEAHASKSRKQTEKKRNNKNTKKKIQVTQVPTKGALKGFDSIKMSASAQNPDIISGVSSSRQQKRRKKVTSGKKAKNSKSSSKCSEPHCLNDCSDSERDIYEFKDNEDNSEVFDLRVSTVMDRFRSMHNTERLKHKERSKEKGKEKIKVKVVELEQKQKEKNKYRDHTSHTLNKEYVKVINYEATDDEPFVKKQGRLVPRQVDRSLTSEQITVENTIDMEHGDHEVNNDFGGNHVDDLSYKNVDVLPLAAASCFVPDRDDESTYESDPSPSCFDDNLDDYELACNCKNDLEASKNRVNQSAVVTCAHKKQNDENAAKNAVMEKIFKNNAVRCERLDSDKNKPLAPKPDLDRLFDSLLESEPNEPDSTLEIKNNKCNDSTSLQKSPIPGPSRESIPYNEETLVTSESDMIGDNTETAASVSQSLEITKISQYEEDGLNTKSTESSKVYLPLDIHPIYTGTQTQSPSPKSYNNKTVSCCSTSDLSDSFERQKDKVITSTPVSPIHSPSSNKKCILNDFASTSSFYPELPSSSLITIPHKDIAQKSNTMFPKRGPKVDRKSGDHRVTILSKLEDLKIVANKNRATTRDYVPNTSKHFEKQPTNESDCGLTKSCVEMTPQITQTDNINESIETIVTDYFSRHCNSDESDNDEDKKMHDSSISYKNSTKDSLETQTYLSDNDLSSSSGSDDDLRNPQSPKIHSMKKNLDDKYILSSTKSTQTVSTDREKCTKLINLAKFRNDKKLPNRKDNIPNNHYMTSEAGETSSSKNTQTKNFKSHKSFSVSIKQRQTVVTTKEQDSNAHEKRAAKKLTTKSESKISKYEDDTSSSEDNETTFTTPCLRPSLVKSSPTRKSDEGISTSHDFSADAFELFPHDEMGVARQRARRKCTVGKQNVLAEHWSSESEVDGVPPRPNSADSVVVGVGRKKRARRKESHPSGKRGNRNALKNEGGRGSSSRHGWHAQRGGDESCDEARAGPSRAPPGPKMRARPSHHYCSSDDEDSPGPQPQHGWIVGDSHKKLVTMLAHAKGRKRNNDDR